MEDHGDESKVAVLSTAVERYFQR